MNPAAPSAPHLRLLHLEDSPADAELIHPDLGEYSFVEAAFSPQPGTNIANITRIRKGDIEQGFAEAEWVIEREYTNPSVQHVPMETHVAIVQSLIAFSEAGIEL